MAVFPERFTGSITMGKSMPCGSRDKAYKNAASLAYLTAEQASAEFEVLVTDLKGCMLRRALLCCLVIICWNMEA
ncbi:hypothetical protein MKX03_003931 [Papaver bracteatum]|nr:hypothetical protein MKX03_003931 [Papaver bracteatum]